MKKIILTSLILSMVPFMGSQAALTSVGLDKQYYTSDFMMGEVAVSIIFTESDGSLDPNSESWDEARKTKVISEIMAGLNWWTTQNPKSPLSFTYVTETVNTKYEPITRPYWSEALWIPDVMGKLGYSGSRFTATRNYVNDLRDNNNTDWAFIIFMVDSLNDFNGKFSDGSFAYAYLGGPFMVMTYDNNGYGIDNMDVVAAHEMGHIFHALDEYAGGSSPAAYSFGYFPTINGNHAYSATANDDNSIMRGGIRWGLSSHAKTMIGWRDSNNNGYDDILDQKPSVGVLINSSALGSDDQEFTGQTSVTVLPRQSNVNGYGLTIDTIARVEFRVSGSEWSEAVPTDGTFDSATESFQVVIDASSLNSSVNIQSQDVEIRVLTSYALNGGDTGIGVTSSGALSNAHPYPNPFKPNSFTDHVDVKFTGLTAGAKVQIFTVAGEPVFEQVTDTSGSDLVWLGRNDDGSNVSSGVYFYLITDTSGNLKKGKLAIVR